MCLIIFTLHFLSWYSKCALGLRQIWLPCNDAADCRLDCQYSAQKTEAHQRTQGVGETWCNAARTESAYVRVICLLDFASAGAASDFSKGNGVFAHVGPSACIVKLRVDTIYLNMSINISYCMPEITVE